MAKRIHKNACHVSHNISKKTVISSFPEGSRTREWLDSLDDAQWSITTFIPETRLVCATIYGDSGTATHLAITLPEIITKSLT